MNSMPRVNRWNQQFSQDDESLAIDGKTMRNARSMPEIGKRT